MKFDIIQVTKTFSPQTEALLSTQATIVRENQNWDDANNEIDKLTAEYLAAGGMIGFVSKQFILYPAGHVPANAAGCTAYVKVTLPPFSRRADGWAMRDGRPQSACANCGTWGDHDTRCCVLPELPF